MIQPGSKEFTELTQFIEKISGIVITDSKSYLLRQRIQPILPELGFESFDQLLERVRLGRTMEFKGRIIEAITTNETSFFRDDHPFKAFQKEILPRIEEEIRKGKNYDIFCAGCSTGQEPYTLAMLIDDFLNKQNCTALEKQRVRITAGDISLDALAKCKSGEYSVLEIGRGLPEYYQIMYFTKTENGNYRISDDLKRYILFKQINLCDPMLFLPKRQHLVMSRNILIYFDREKVERIISKYHECLLPGGYLVLGSSESLHLIKHSFQSLRVHGSSFFQKALSSAV